MAAPVTELVDFALPPSADLTTAFPAVCKTLMQQSGCRAARYSRHHEDATKLTFFVDWDSISAHEAFCANTLVYDPFYASLAPFHTAEAPLTPYHIAFDPTAAGVLDVAPAVEVLHLHFPVDYDLQSEQTTLKTLWDFIAIAQKAAGADGMDLLVGTPALGWAAEEMEWKGEKVRLLVAAIGWKSVEAHMKYRDTDVFRESIGMVRGVDGLKGISVYHVACAET